MNRGSMARFGSLASAAVCFNEAPIHESGKSPLRSRARVRALGFNEAPINESGK